MDEHQLDKHAIEALAVQRFGRGVRLLNKVEASGLIDELLETYGNGPRPPARGARKQQVNGSAYQGGDKGRAAA